SSVRPWRSGHVWIARWDSASTTVPVKPPPSKVWNVASMVVRPDADTISRHFARKRSPSRSSCGSQRQPVRSPMRCRPFMFLTPPKCEGETRGSSLAFHPRLSAQTALFNRAQFVQNLRKCSNLLVRLFNPLLTNRVDQSASDRDFAWKFGQLQYFEPLGVLYFRFLRPHVAVHPVADERDHQRVRERPRLAGEVADVAYAHADFLLHLARQALLERLARFDEAGERAVHAGGEMGAASEEHLRSPAHERHDGRRHSRVGRQLAARADARALLAFRLCRR